MDKDTDRKCCDTCKHYEWYYDKCSKYNCETDARARCSEYEPMSEPKGENK